jgi:hypothetical protein
MNTTIVNKVGLEAEFFLRNKNGKNLLFPGKHGFSIDEFIILGEFRAEPGKTREETLSNFMKEWYGVLFKAKKQEENIDIETGYAEVDPEFYVNIMRTMERKTIAQALNIHPEIDILKLTDAVVENGVILKHYLSIGLHVHFSSTITDEKITKRREVTYLPANIPLTFNAGSVVATMNLFQMGDIKETEEKLSVSVSRITKPVLFDFINKLDKEILEKYKIEDVPLKYRNPGFYELKPWGFEYRSLPFNKLVLENVAEIVDYSFGLLESLEL